MSEIVWENLNDAYGPAANIEELIESAFLGNSSAWEELWSRLCHQGDIYSASLAAFPLLVAKLIAQDDILNFNALLLPAVIEYARLKKKKNIPDKLSRDYFEALQKFTAYVAELSSEKGDRSLVKAVRYAKAVINQSLDEAEKIDNEQ